MSAYKLELVDDIMMGNKVIQNSLQNLNRLEAEQLLVLQELLTWLKNQEEELDKLMVGICSSLEQ